jgi:hypothetical protein
MVSNFTNECKDIFSVDERSLITETAGKMLKDSVVQQYLQIGKKMVCLERQDSKDKTVKIFLMNETLEMNNEVVTRFNKRKKTA